MNEYEWWTIWDYDLAFADHGLLVVSLPGERFRVYDLLRPSEVVE